MANDQVSSLAFRAVRPASDEHNAYYEKYVSLVPDGDVLVTARSQQVSVKAELLSVADADTRRLHAPYTWTLCQVVGHLIDVERIFADRIHRIAAQDPQPQLGMEQNVFVDGYNYMVVAWTDLVEEWSLCRAANLMLLQRLDDSAWDRRGVASGYSVSVRALAWMLVGHVTYHLQIVRNRLKSDSAAPPSSC